MSRHQTPLSLEYVLLGLLEQQAMHGYDLFKTLKSLDGLSAIWHVNQSQLYAILDKLKKLGYLSTVEVTGEAHPMRKEFHITPAGKSRLLTWMISPVERGRDMRQEFLAKLYFARLAGEEISKTLLIEQQKTCQGWLIPLKETLHHDRKRSDYHRMVYEFRICQTEAMITWLTQCRDELSNNLSI